MGAVSIDVHKKERDYKNLTLSDENVVKYLILYRSKVDVAHGASSNIDINKAGDMMDFNIELIVLYASLDKLISEMDLKNKDREFLKLVFEGNEIMDIITIYNFPIKTAYRTLDRIVKKIVEKNFSDWKKCMKEQGYIL